VSFFVAKTALNQAVEVFFEILVSLYFIVFQLRLDFCSCLMDHAVSIKDAMVIKTGWIGKR